MNDFERQPNGLNVPVKSTTLAAATTTSTAHRRALLRGIGAGTAVAGGALPLKAHAYYSGKYCVHPFTGKNHHATVSGCQSVIMSIQVGNPNCVKGHKCSHYKTGSNWPSGCNNGYGFNFNKDSRFCDVFKCGSSNYRDKSLIWLCTNRSTSAEAHWACAIANAKKRTPFAYTQKAVVDYYNGTSSAAALQFFTTFCETEA